ncbi:glycoside hydrolase family 3 protein [Massilia atriviolacea]|uniref:Glycoside hydrolase family 3 protein n=2 Tax=Massilia atriviolacea TaxID=2495579 RepID=A0A430HIA4_9BURK|nr:glycoside hydrolase family 3 protein [Massilia atriviolacea]
MLAACDGGSDPATPDIPTPPVAVDKVTQYSDFPSISSDIKKDAATESAIAAIVAGMSLAEKVGQMTQPEIKSITPEQVRQYYIGSVLNGGGSFPGNNKLAAPADWLKLADAYWKASMATDAKVRIPVIWGTDAVHGHNNVFGATMFPHNIGLGAANDPALMRRIGAAVAAQVYATGIDWTFAPTLAVVRDDRWGRTYEGYSEDPLIVTKYAREMVKGLQNDFAGSGNVIATAKHFIGDGGTDQGRDQGVNMSSRNDMINIHGQGYYHALGAGAQTVMASFNSWDNESLAIKVGKMHGSKEMLTDVLKTRMGFDGFVIGDWNGHGQVAGCSDGACPQAINAGVDMIMVPDKWKEFIANTIASVNKGEIALARIDDAVTRILRVKFRAGIMSAKAPLERPHTEASRLQHRALAREAVQKSLVLLKNDNKLLPLKRGDKILVVGKSADSLSNQTGGWSLTWQGTANTNADFPNADSILTAIRSVAGEANVVYSQSGAGVKLADFKAVIAVIGETPYAEGVGDIGRSGTLEHARRFPEDLAVLDAVSGKGVPVVTVLITGRPLWVNKELNRSDAFVVAWLPGTEGKGVTDVLFRKDNGDVNVDLKGKLSFSWPRTACQMPNKGDPNYDPLFAYGFGMRYADDARLARLDETAPTLGCAQGAGNGGQASVDLEVFRSADQAPYTTRIGDPSAWSVPLGADLNAVTTLPNVKAETTQVNVQQDARKITWSGAGQFYAQAAGTADREAYLNADAALVFDTIVHKAPAGAVKMRVDCKHPCLGEVDATTLFKGLAPDLKRTVKLPLSCFAAKGADFTLIDTPFLVYTEKAFVASFANIRWVPGAARDADAAACASLVPEPPVFGPPVPGPSYPILNAGALAGDLALSTYSSNGSHTKAAITAADGLEMRFAADGGDGLVMITGTPVNLSNFAGGTLQFEINVGSYGANTGGLAVKMESPGNNCKSGDYLFGRPAPGIWTPVSVKVGALTAAADPCFDLRNIGMPFGTLPKWGDQQGVQYRLRQIRFVQ